MASRSPRLADNPLSTNNPPSGHVPGGGFFRASRSAPCPPDRVSDESRACDPLPPCLPHTPSLADLNTHPPCRAVASGGPFPAFGPENGSLPRLAPSDGRQGPFPSHGGAFPPSADPPDATPSRPCTSATHPHPTHCPGAGIAKSPRAFLKAGTHPSTTHHAPRTPCQGGRSSPAPPFACVTRPRARPRQRAFLPVPSAQPGRPPRVLATLSGAVGAATPHSGGLAPARPAASFFLIYARPLRGRQRGTARGGRIARPPPVSIHARKSLGGNELCH